VIRCKLITKVKETHREKAMNLIYLAVKKNPCGKNINMHTRFPMELH
jgi:hypothetical protein